MEHRAPSPAPSAAPAPVVAAVVPSTGPSSGGNTVVVYGAGFLDVTAVRFGSWEAIGFTVVTTGQINAVVPPGVGTVPVTVTTPGGTSNATVTYTYVGAPVTPALTSVVPSEGPLQGGNTVTLHGSGLTGTYLVLFGGNPATSFTVDSPVRITAVAPAGPAGAAAVRVITPGGVGGPVTYFYTAGPVLASIAPAEGPVTGGTTVVLTGSSLTGVQAVRFGAQNAPSFTVDSSTQITAVSPAGPAGGGTVPVTVVPPGGTSGPVSFTYRVVPVVTSAVPARGPLHGGTAVTLKGSGLTTTSAVRFGTTLAPFTVESDGSITATAPPGTPGPVAVTVTTAGGTSAPVTYVRVPPPSV